MHDAMRVINNGHAGTFMSITHNRFLTKGMGLGAMDMGIGLGTGSATHMQTSLLPLRGDWEQATVHRDPHGSGA